MIGFTRRLLESPAAHGESTAQEGPLTIRMFDVGHSNLRTAHRLAAPKAVDRVPTSQKADLRRNLLPPLDSDNTSNPHM